MPNNCSPCKSAQKTLSKISTARTSWAGIEQEMSLNVYPLPPTRYEWTVLDAWKKEHNSTYKNLTRSTSHLRPQHLININQT